MNMKILSVTVLILFCISFTVAKAYAHNPGYEITSIYGTTPTIDGTISSEEWDDASRANFNYSVVYIKHDGKSLYFAFNVSDPTVDPNNDGIITFIDINHDGSPLFENEDRGFLVYRNGTALEIIPASPSRPPDGNWTATAQEISGGYTAEYNITYNKVELTQGVAKILGLCLYSRDSSVQEYFWPTTGSPGSPSTWGDLTSPDDWIPEFQTIVAITILMTAILLTATIRRKKQL